MAKLVNKKRHIIKWSAIMASVAAVVVAANCIASSPMFYGIITMALGGAKYKNVGGSADLDTEYYKKSTNSQDEAIKSTEETIIPKAVNEGMVLLENDSNLLPLKGAGTSKAKVSIFGYDTVFPVPGGTGSGQSFGKVTMKSALETDNFEVNPSVWNLSDKSKNDYKRGECDVIMNTADFRLKEFPSSIYTAAEPTYSQYDTAIYMIGRMGGEAFDLPRDMGDWEGDKGRHYLEMTSAEESLLTYITNKFKKVIVIYNTAGNPFEVQRANAILEDAKKKDSDFKYATMFVAGLGSTGANGIGDVLNGSVSPSGKMTDTWVYDFTADPSYVNSGDFQYGNLDKVSYIEYEEGIYVGYRYYETMDAIKKDNGDWYKKTVSYPFGYGKSYATFSQTIRNFTTNENTISFDVTVRNNESEGGYSGKDVVQIYISAPYKTNGIEKAHKVLLDFEKTDTLNPGQEETIHFELNKEDFASYDYKNEKAYVLDDGEYTIFAGKDAHDSYDSKSFNQENKIVYSGNNKRSSDKIPATNLYDDMSEYMEKATTQLTRSDEFKGGVTAPEGNKPVPDYTSEFLKMKLSEALLSKDPAVDYTYKAPEVKDVMLGAEKEVELIQLRGLSYDNPLWDKLLNQLSEKEIKSLVGTGGYQTKSVSSINKPATKDPDGPAGFSSFMDGSIKGSSIPAATLIACTWSKEIANKLGEAIGEEALQGGYSGWYAPATNIHRYPLSGRHFEYYSEDPVLAGQMTTEIVEGAAKKGLYAYIKHFAMNEQETNRKTNNNVATWANEQAVREIYLKPFEMCVKNATMEVNYLSETKDKNGKTIYANSTKTMKACTAIMSSYNRVGAIWSGGRYGLMTTTLRGEWGFEGMVVTDYFTTNAQNMSQMLRAGNDLALTTIPATVPFSTAEDKYLAREASHNILYTVVNSNAMNGKSFGVKQVEIMPTWQLIAIIVSCVIGAAWLVWGTILILDGTGKTHLIYELTDEKVEKKSKKK